MFSKTGPRNVTQSSMSTTPEPPTTSEPSTKTLEPPRTPRKQPTTWTSTDKPSQPSTVSADSFSPTTQSLYISSSYSTAGRQKEPSTQLSSETSTTHISQVSKSITPTPPFDIGTCGYYCSLNALITQNRVSDPGTDICPGGSRDSGDALPIVCCNITQSVHWKAGQHVIQNCDNMRMYNPIASFIDGSLLNGTSGIFLGCIENGSGFQMLRQNCDKATHLVRITKQQDEYPSPNTFYVVKI